MVRQMTFPVAHKHNLTLLLLLSVYAICQSNVQYELVIILIFYIMLSLIFLQQEPLQLLLTITIWI